jgi:hypothetical protein
MEPPSMLVRVAVIVALLLPSAKITWGLEYTTIVTREALQGNPAQTTRIAPDSMAIIDFKKYLMSKFQNSLSFEFPGRQY